MNDDSVPTPLSEDEIESAYLAFRRVTEGPDGLYAANTNRTRAGVRAALESVWLARQPSPRQRKRPAAPAVAA